MGPGGMMQLGRIRCLWRLMALVVCDVDDADGVTLSKSRMASGSGLPVLEVHQAERDNCILAGSF